MTGQPRPKCSSHLLLWRPFWGVILLLHLPVTVRILGALLSESNGASASPVLLILATNCFFLLEIVAAPTRRLLTNRRRVAAFLLVVVLFHVGLVDQGLTDDPDVNGARQWLLVATMGSQLWMALRRAIGVQFRGTDDYRGRTRRPASGVPAALTHISLSPQAYWRVAPERAPPSSHLS